MRTDTKTRVAFESRARGQHFVMRHATSAVCGDVHRKHRRSIANNFRKRRTSQRKKNTPLCVFHVMLSAKRVLFVSWDVLLGVHGTAYSPAFGKGDIFLKPYKFQFYTRMLVYYSQKDEQR